MILIGLGSNLAGRQYDSPHSTLKAAIRQMTNCGITIKETSRLYESEPLPKSDQPWFVNAVVAVETALSAAELLRTLHGIEESLGRERRVRWEARIIDLDILAYDNEIYPAPEYWHEAAINLTSRDMIIPHPRLHERLFVLKPLMDICPDWKHPVFGKVAGDYIELLEKSVTRGVIRPLQAGI